MKIGKPQSRDKNGSFSTTSTFTPKSVKVLKTMDLTSPKHLNPPSPSSYGKGKSNVGLFTDTFPDPLCKLNLTETCEFVKSFPVAVQRRGAEALSTPLFSFSHSRKSFPSKWDDAEKWLISHHSPAHALRPSQCQNFAFPDKCRVTEEKLMARVGAGAGTGATPFSHVPLKDKFTDNVDPIVPNFRYSEPSTEGFLFGNPRGNASTEVVHHRDIGTEMTPLGSSTTSRCHTPFKSSSPARHNTPSNRSGLLAMVNPDSTMEVCHLAKLQLGTQYASNWSSKEEEEEEISKSLRHFETSNGFRTSVSESRAAAWEEEGKTKCCLRYQREEAKIQAWVNLQNAKAEAQSKKLEVKIQKMRSDLEEKLMKRMASVQRKAEEWRISAQQQHSGQVQRGGEQGRKMMNSQLYAHTSCGCFPCNKTSPKS